MQNTALARVSLVWALAVAGVACGTGSAPTAPAPGAAEPSGTAPAATGDEVDPAVPSVGGDPSSAGRCKRGLASAGEVRPNLSANDLVALSPNVVWWYNWGTDPGGADVVAAATRLGVEYVPMVFTAPFDANAIAKKILPTTRHLLTFNEPNFREQGNLTPQQAASYWPQIEKIADQHNLLIVSPALNYCGGACNATDPFAWLDAFFAACPGCRVDHLAIHAYVCYASALDAAYLQPFVKKYGKKIWLTEFSCLDGSADASKQAEQDRYLREVVPVLEAHPMVYRYSWFLARSSQPAALDILAADGKLAASGKTYTALPTSCGAN